MSELIQIQNLIYEIRGHKVMLDRDLARLYCVEVKVLNQAVKRNMKRFPMDFMFQLTVEEQKQVVTNCDHLQTGIELTNLKSQIVTSSSQSGWGGRRKLPFVFTEQGVAMLSSVLNSQRAIDTNIEIMRAFVKIRQYALQRASHLDEIKELKQLLLLHIDNTDKRFDEHNTRINQIISVLNNLMEHPKPKRKIGFKPDDDK